MSDRSTLVLTHMNIAETLAAKKKRRVPPSVTYDDLKSAAYLGLVDAAAKYDAAYGTPFDLYARVRIAGAIKDYLRECGWGPRGNPVIMGTIDAAPNDRPSLAATLSARPAREAGDLFVKLADRLAPAGRNALAAYYVEGLKMREVAARLGVSEGRVSQIISGSKKILRAAWGDRREDLWREVA